MSDSPVPTIRDVAREAGVSLATVSRALNCAPNCPESTRRLVAQAVEKLGYRRDPAGVILGGRRRSRARTDRLAVAHLYGPRDRWPEAKSDPTFSETAEQMGYLPYTESLASMDELGAKLDSLYARGCQLLLLKLVTPEPFWELPVGWERFAVTSLSIQREDDPFHHVRRRRSGDVYKAFEELLARGYRRIAPVLFRHPQLEETDIEWRGAVDGYAAMRLGEASIPPMMFEQGKKPADFVKWMKRHRPDAVLASFTSVYHWLSEAGYRMPEDLGFVTLHGGNRPVESQDGRRLILTGFDVKSSWKFIVRAVLRHLEALWKHSERGIPPMQEMIEIPAPWVAGETVRERS